MAGQTLCGLKGCNRPLMAGARIGYQLDNQLFEVIVCKYHLEMITPGGYTITQTGTGDPFLKPTPAKRIII